MSLEVADEQEDLIQRFRTVTGATGEQIAVLTVAPGVRCTGSAGWSSRAGPEHTTRRYSSD